MVKGQVVEVGGDQDIAPACTHIGLLNPWWILLWGYVLRVQLMVVRPLMLEEQLCFSQKDTLT